MIKVFISHCLSRCILSLLCLFYHYLTFLQVCMVFLHFILNYQFLFLVSIGLPSVSEVVTHILLYRLLPQISYSVSKGPRSTTAVVQGPFDPEETHKEVSPGANRSRPRGKRPAGWHPRQVASRRETCDPRRRSFRER